MLARRAPLLAAAILSALTLAGDVISASVTVSGHAVKLFIANRTRGTSFTKQLTAARVDVGSAEWIVEAPSACIDNGGCRTLPLADFGTTPFANARATSVSGRAGTITDPAWSAVAITLTPGRGPGHMRFTTEGGAGSAAPADLSPAGDAFTVTYQPGHAAPPATRAHELARALGVLEPDGTCRRGTFVIDPEGVVRHATISDGSVGRSAAESLRVVRALRTGELCPASWLPGQPYLLAA